MTDRLETITGQIIPLVVADIRGRAALEQAISSHGIEAVIHFAGLKAVDGAMVNPLIYYDNNVQGTLTLVEAMIAYKVKIQRGIQPSKYAGSHEARGNPGSWRWIDSGWQNLLMRHR